MNSRAVLSSGNRDPVSRMYLSATSASLCEHRPTILISLWGPTGNLYDVGITFVLIFCAPGPRAAAPEYPSGCTFSLNHSTYLYLCKVKTVFCKSWRNSL